MTLERAIAFATKAHEGQTRRYDGTPYILHPIEVMTLLQTRGFRGDILIAAVLHDVLEDTPTTYDQLRRAFGGPIADLVLDLTKVGGKSRKERTANEAKRLGRVSKEAQTIKYADIICNTKDIRAKDPEFAKTYLLEKLHQISNMSAGDSKLREDALAQIVKGLLP